jgi:hypothetical protein
MRCLTVLVLCSTCCVFAQGDPPPEVDQALRARVQEFFGYAVTGEFRKAEALVAEDTKDYYFARGKNRFESFTIGKIEYSDKFTRATVMVNAKHMVQIGQFPATLIEQPISTTWKIEDGKWMWYVDPASVPATPMGPSAPPPASTEGKLPDLSPDAMNSRAQSILKKSSLDKSAVSLDASRESSEQVIFHNGQAGGVMVYVNIASQVEGFTAKVAKNALKGGEDVPIVLHYVPGKQPPPKQVKVEVIDEPFGQTFPIVVTFAK